MFLLQTLYETEHDKSFSDIYNNHVKEFNMKTKNMKEAQRFAVCAKPGMQFIFKLKKF